MRDFTDVCLYGGGGGTNLPPTIQTSVNYHNFAQLYLRSLKTYHFQTWPGLLEAWLVLTSVKYHGNHILIPLNQRLALTRLRATGPESDTS